MGASSLRSCPSPSALHHAGDASTLSELDPATGLPAAGPWRTATVAAGTCADANIASTAPIVMGALATGWLERHRMTARLVSRGGVIVRLAGWPEPADSKPVPKIL